MNFEEFQAWVGSLVAQGRLTAEQRSDVETQRQLFDANRDMIEAEYWGRLAGYLGGELLVADRVRELLDRAREIYDGRRQLYFEPVGFDPF